MTAQEFKIAFTKAMSLSDGRTPMVLILADKLVQPLPKQQEK